MEVETEGTLPEGNDTKAQEPESGWMTMIPKDIATEKTELFSQYGGFNDFVSDAVSKMERYGDLESQLEKAIPLPESDDWNPVWQKLGKPENLDGYEIDEKPVAEVFFNANLTKEQAQKVTEGLRGIAEIPQDELLKQREEAYMNAIGTLKEKYGDEIETKLTEAKTAIKNLGGEQLATTLQERGLDNDPGMLDFFVKLGGLMQEGHIPIGHQLRPKAKGLVGMYKSMDGMT